MNVAKIKPWGMSSLFGLRAGVQRNTKVYIEPSNRDWIAPSSAIFSSTHRKFKMSEDIFKEISHSSDSSLFQEKRKKRGERGDQSLTYCME